MPAEPIYQGEGSYIEGGTFESPSIHRPGGIVPELYPLPDLSRLTNLSDADLWAVLQRHGVTQPWPELIAEAQRYNERWSKVPPGQWADEQARALIVPDAQSTDILGRKMERGLLGLARRTQERYTTMEALDGDVNAELGRVAELDSATCVGCDALAGSIGTYAFHVSQGLPGEQQCGNNCRCQLIRVE